MTSEKEERAGRSFMWFLMENNPVKQPSKVEITPVKQPCQDVHYLCGRLDGINERFNKMAAAFQKVNQQAPITDRLYYVHPVSSPITNEIDTAHASSIGKLRNVGREAKGNRGKYAKIEHITDYANPILSSFGLSIVQLPSHNEYGQDILITRLTHSSGQWYEARVILQPNPSSPNHDQAIGGCITYQRRYAALAILGIAATDDPSDILE